MFPDRWHVLFILLPLSVFETEAYSLNVLKKANLRMEEDDDKHHHDDQHNHKSGVCSLPHYGENPEFTKKLFQLEEKLAQQLGKLEDPYVDNSCQRFLSKYLKEYREDATAIEKDKKFYGRNPPVTSGDVVAENPIFALRLVRRQYSLLFGKTLKYCKGNNDAIVETVRNAFEKAGLVPPKQLELERSFSGILAPVFIHRLNISGELRHGKIGNFQTSAKLKFEDLMGIAQIVMGHDVEGIMSYHWLSAAAEALQVEGESDQEPESLLALDQAWERVLEMSGIPSMEKMHIILGWERIGKWSEAKFDDEYLCRGEGTNIPYNTNPADLVCFYLRSRNPYFELCPLKVQIVSEAPFLLQFFDFLTSKEIRFIREEAPASTVKDWMVGKKEDFKDEAEYAVALQDALFDAAWVKNRNTVMQNLVKKVEILTKLQVNKEMPSVFEMSLHSPLSQFWNVEQSRGTLSVFKSGSITEEATFATFLMHLTDVRLGGYTTFPNLNVYTEPKKGSVLLYFNHNRKNKPEKLLHIEPCPVGLGVKEVASIPLHRPEGASVDPLYFIRDPQKHEQKKNKKETRKVKK